MAESAAFAIGADVECTDGPCGRLIQVVVDPVRRAVTHLLVEPEHRQGLGRLVPVEWAKPAGNRVELTCTRREFDALEVAEGVQFMEGSEGQLGYDPEQALLWPYYGGNTSVPEVVDYLPPGEVAIKRDDEVQATDGTIGQVDGLIVDESTYRVTHLVLREGHLFGRKDVAIPVSAVQSVDEHGVRLSMSKQQIEDLPPVEFSRPGRS